MRPTPYRPSPSFDPYQELLQLLRERSQWQESFLARVLAHAYVEHSEQEFYGREAWRTIRRWLHGRIREATQADTRRFWKTIERAEDVFKRLGPFEQALSVLRERGCPPSAVASALGVGEGTAESWLRGEHRPQAEKAYKFIKLFSRDPSQLR